MFGHLIRSALTCLLLAGSVLVWGANPAGALQGAAGKEIPGRVSPWPAGFVAPVKDIGQLRIGTGIEANSLDPAEQTTSLMANLGDLIFDRFFHQTPEGRLEARLATGYTISPDGLEVAITLRPGVTFSDGTPLDAQAVKASWDRLLDPARSIPLGQALNMVQGCRIIDEKSVALELKHPFAALGSVLTLSLCSPVSPQALKKWGPDFRHNPVGAGPYVLQEWIKGRRIVLERNESYYGPRPTVRELVWQVVPNVNKRENLLRAGKLDICLRPVLPNVKTLAADPGFLIANPTTTRTFFLRLNTRKGPARDKAVRQALNLAIDRTALIREILHGQAVPLSGPVSPVVFGSAEPGHGPSYDQGKAASLLKAAGFDFSRPFRIASTFSEFQFQRRIAQAIQKSLKALGIDTQVSFLDWPTYLAELAKPLEKSGFDALLLGWSPLHADADPAYDYWFRGGDKGDRVPIPNYDNTEFDRLLTKSRSEYDPRARLQLLQEAGRLVREESPWVWLYAEKFPVAFSDRIKNLVVTSTEKIYPQYVVID